VTQLLVDREKQMQAAVHNLGPYTRILSNIIGTGPWFDAYAANFFGLGAGEFVPGPEDGFVPPAGGG
jgi:phospholipid/cholesterol/gamma-HCH transport system substrate-binding protein